MRRLIPWLQRLRAVLVPDPIVLVTIQAPDTTVETRRRVDPDGQRVTEIVVRRVPKLEMIPSAAPPKGELYPRDFLGRRRDDPFAPLDDGTRRVARAGKAPAAR